jgi:hypothetical protein
MNNGQPFVLTCRYHSQDDHFDYYHMPSNPTGSVSFDSDNSVAEIVAVPRTMRSFQPNKYCHSYQLNKVLGNYSGMSSLFLVKHSIMLGLIYSQDVLVGGIKPIKKVESFSSS